MRRPVVDPDHHAVGVLLAGGTARRMGGGDKCLKPLAGRPILAHVIDRIAPQVSRLALNANGDPDRFAAFGLPVVPDAGGEATGPLAGILTGMRWATRVTRTTKQMLSVPADTPFLPRDLVARLQAATTNARGVAVAWSRGQDHPVVALWPVALADDLERWLKRESDKSVRGWVAHIGSARVDFDDVASGADPFFNINTPDDAATAAQWVEQVS